MKASVDHDQGLDKAIEAELAPQLANLTTRQQKTNLAASVLFFGHGIYPSAKTILKFTRQGSLGDINKDLRGFWANLRQAGQARLEFPMLPDAVVAEFAVALGKVWETAVAKANRTLDGEREELAAERGEIQHQIEEANRQQAYAEEKAQELSDELRNERQLRQAAENEVASLQAKVDALTQSVTSWMDKAEAESKSRQDAEQQFSKDLQAERDARARDNEVFEGEIKFAKMQIDSARTTERELREQIKSERATREMELIAYRQRANAAEDALGAARLSLAEAKATIKVLEAQADKANERGREKPVAPKVARPAIKKTTLRKKRSC